MYRPPDGACHHRARRRHNGGGGGWGGGWGGGGGGGRGGGRRDASLGTAAGEAAAAILTLAIHTLVMLDFLILSWSSLLRLPTLSMSIPTMVAGVVAAILSMATSLYFPWLLSMAVAALPSNMCMV